ncbi:PREDICTED: RNA-directed DNA polymerase from mobile element jockey-like, partial [Rhagoletis zephyria]|uniref:RNA-directed DNA polymerase from mobile element jockey-like n=1 Tax=Rhagoletis zephyria TaxID=28612 RepID=UPI000811832C
MDLGISLVILQWNIQGFLNNKFGLELLVTKHKPDIIMLQETHIIEKNKHLLHLPHYKVYHFNKTYSYSKAGIAILVKETLNTSNYKISNNNLLFQSITIHALKDLHITNIYREIDLYLTAQHLDDIHTYHNGYHLLGGDLNAHNALWGAKKTNQNGKLWEDFANDKQFVILNDGSPTLLNTRNTLTNVDVSMACGGIAPVLTWNCLPPSGSSNHFPILIFNNMLNINSRINPRFNTNKANWHLFTNKTNVYSQNFTTSVNINREAAQIKKVLRKAANESMPTTFSAPKHNSP